MVKRQVVFRSASSSCRIHHPLSEVSFVSLLSAGCSLRPSKNEPNKPSCERHLLSRCPHLERQECSLPAFASRSPVECPHMLSVVLTAAVDKVNSSLQLVTPGTPKSSLSLLRLWHNTLLLTALLTGCFLFFSCSSICCLRLLLCAPFKCHQPP